MKITSDKEPSWHRRLRLQRSGARRRLNFVTDCERLIAHHGSQPSSAAIYQYLQVMNSPKGQASKGKGKGKGKGKSAGRPWTGPSCLFVHPASHNKCDWCFQAQIRSQQFVHDPSPTIHNGSGRSRRWGGYQAKAPHQSPTRTDVRPQRHHPNGSSGGSPSHITSDKILSFIKLLGIDDHIIDEIQDKIDTKYANPMKESWQLTQSYKDKIKNYDKGINALEEEITLLQSTIDKKIDEQVELKRIRKETAQKLSAIDTDPANEFDTRFHQMNEWIDKFQQVMSNGADRVEPSLLNDLYASVPRVSEARSPLLPRSGQQQRDASPVHEPMSADGDVSANGFGRPLPRRVRARGSPTRASRVRSASRSRGRSAPPRSRS